MFGKRSPLQLTVGALTHPGRVRSINQDWWGRHTPPDARQLAAKGSLFIVADGMGGRAGGDIASRLAVQNVLHFYYQDTSRNLARSLQMAIRQANAQIINYGYHYPAYRGMATTLVAAVQRDREVVIAHVGDSRAYLTRSGQVWALTQDHSWVVEMMARGALSPTEAVSHPYRHVITRSLGHQPDVQVDLRRLKFGIGDTLVLCTDGLSDVVSSSEIGWATQTLTPGRAAQTMVGWANQRGGRDNISAMVVRADKPASNPARRGVPHPQYQQGARVLTPAGAGYGRQQVVQGESTGQVLAVIGAAAALVTLAMYALASF